MDVRRLVFQGIVLVIGIIFLVKLFFIQVAGSSYAEIAKSNSLLVKTIYPNRGIMRDRNGELVVLNKPVFTLRVVPKEVPKDLDTLALLNLLGMERKEFEEKLYKATQYSRHQPSEFMKQVSPQDFAKFQDQLVRFPGFRAEARNVRYYPDSILSSGLGYIGEINKRQLERDTTDYYKQGDMLGISGLESTYEEYLRGIRGKRNVMVNVRGVEKGRFMDGNFDTLAQTGAELTLTIDKELQKYAEKLMRGKQGSLVAIEPSTGEILAIVSAPVYNPNLLVGREFGKNFMVLNADTTKPLFNRPIMAMYPPGSIFKTLQALIALQEGVIGPNEKISSYNGPMGDHAPDGMYDIVRGITYSSNTFFYYLFQRIILQGRDDSKWVDSRLGLDAWSKYVVDFGFGQPLGIDLPNEKGGLVPTSAYYNKWYGENRWQFSYFYSVSIGQGELLTTPLQIANLGAIIANKGYYYIPHLVKDIGGEGKMPKYTEKHDTGVEAKYFEPVKEGMRNAVYGTARRAVIDDIAVCGKTGTSENPHGEDHSVFMAFAPCDNPTIAVSAYVENSGWGGRAAASTASLVMEKYIRGYVKRKSLEDYVIKGDFLY
jgi:penicillin-binding protein 2